MVRLFTLICVPFVFALTLHAQTSGSVAPEVLQFEPVDASSLVDRRTGDFSYTLPVLVIPGAPGGAWPLSLTYKAGISFQQEASWVGLGWNLTPGQVTRTVRGYPDDYLDVNTTHHNNVGGFGSNFSSVPWASGEDLSPVSFAAGYFSQTTYLSWLIDPETFQMHYLDPLKKESMPEQPTGPATITNTTSIFGYIHMPEINDPYDASLDMLRDPLDRLLFQSDILLDLNSRDYEGALGNYLNIDSDRNAEPDWEKNYLDRQGFDADYVSPNVDNYYLAAEGINGFVRPILESRGWLYPATRFFKDELKTDRRVFPYREAASRYKSIYDVNTGDNYTKFFNDYRGGWKSIEDDPSTPYIEANMIFQNDPGLLQKTKVFTHTNEDGTEVYGEGAHIINSARSIRYETDLEGRIIRMIAVNENGTRYIFGLTGADSSELNNSTDSNGRGFRYGAAPQIIRTESISKVADSFADTECPENYTSTCGPCDTTCIFECDDIDRNKNVNSADYAYAWNLAAVESHDYVDQSPFNVYGPEDEGDYIAFRYGTYSADYWWQSPWSDTQLEPNYFYSGRDSANSTKLNFSRQKGAKELVYLKKAETRTHVAVFDLGERNDGQPMVHGDVRDAVMDDGDLGRRGYTPPTYNALELDTNGGRFAKYGAYKYSFQGTEEETDIPIVLPDRFVQEWGLSVNGTRNVDKVTLTSNGTSTTLQNVTLKVVLDAGARYICLIQGVRPLGNTIAWTYPETQLTDVKIQGVAAPLNDQELGRKSDPAPPPNYQVLRRGNNDTELIFGYNTYTLTTDQADHDIPIILPLSYLKRNGITAQTPGVASYLPVFDGVGDFVLMASKTLEVFAEFPEIDKAICLIKGARDNIYLDGTTTLADVRWDYPFTKILNFRLGSCSQPDTTKRGMMKLDRVRLYARDFYATNTNVLDKDCLAAGTTCSGAEEATWDSYLQRIDFNYAASQDELTPGKPNNNVTNGGSLTLTGISTKVFGGISTNNDYTFGYYHFDPNNDEDEFYNIDPWGTYSSKSDASQSIVDPTNMVETYDSARDKWVLTAGAPSDTIPMQAVWSLRTIKTPVGTEIKVEYERDRFAFVQDRPAVDYGKLKGNVSNFNDKGNLTLPTSLTVLNVMESLRNQAQSFTTGEYNGHAVVEVSYKIDNTNHVRPFVVAITDAGKMRADGALEELASFIVSVGDTFTSAQKPTSINHVKLIHMAGNADGPNASFSVQDAGGLRVKSLTMSEALASGGATTPESYQILYTYDQWAKGQPTSLDGRESGVVFNEPLPTLGTAPEYYLLNENGTLNTTPLSDTRLVRPHESAAGEMENIEITYAQSNMAYVGQGDENNMEALEIRRHITARDQMIRDPFYEDWGTQAITQDTFGVESTLSQTPTNLAFTETMKVRAISNDPFLDNGNPVEVSANFTMDQERRNLIVDNTWLVGQLESVEVLDANSLKPISGQQITYTPSFQPGAINKAAGPAGGNTPRSNIGEGFKLKSWSLSGNNLVENHNPNREAGRLYNQGVFVDKNMYLGLHGIRNGSDRYTSFKGSILLTDKVSNTFRPTVTSDQEIFFLADSSTRATEVKSESLAWDYKTGAPALSRSVGAAQNDTTEEDRFIYTVAVPAHYIYQNQTTHGDYDLADLNMVTNPGLVLNAVSNYDLNVVDFLNDLDDPQPAGSDYHHVTSAEFSHWRRPSQGDTGDIGGVLDHPSDKAWVLSAKFNYIHEDETKTSTGWRHLDTQQVASSFSLDVDATGNNGKWQSAVYNKRYDARLNVLEAVNRRGVATAMRLTEIRDVRLPSAQFTNVAWDQVFYDGMESHTADNYTELADAYRSNVSQYLGDFSQVYAGIKSHNLSSPYNANTSLLPSISSGPVWISFYVTSNAGQITVNNAGTLQVNVQESQDHQNNIYVTRVDNGWYHIKARLNSNLGSTLSISSSNGGYLDEVSYYPAAADVVGATETTVVLTGYHPIWLKPTSMTDARGRTKRYEYNKRGGLFRVYDIYGSLLTEHFRSESGKKLSVMDAFVD